MGSAADTASDIIALERAGLDRWGQGDPGKFVELSAPEVTYFDPFIPKRLTGREALAAYYAGLAGKIRLDRYDLIEPKVQVHGETAVLTFNYMSQAEEGGRTSESRWNATEVYGRIGGEWKIIHTHWSRTQP